MNFKAQGRPWFPRLLLHTRSAGPICDSPGEASKSYGRKTLPNRMGEKPFQIVWEKNPFQIVWEKNPSKSYGRKTHGVTPPSER